MWWAIYFLGGEPLLVAWQLQVRKSDHNLMMLHVLRVLIQYLFCKNPNNNRLDNPANLSNLITIVHLQKFHKSSIFIVLCYCVCVQPARFGTFLSALEVMFAAVR